MELNHKFYHPDRVPRSGDKWVLGRYMLERLSYVPVIISSNDVYDTKIEVTAIIDKIVGEDGKQERGWFTELQIDCRILEWYDENGEIKDE